MPLAVMTKPKINKKPGDEKAAVSSSQTPAAETGVEIGMPLFLQRMALSTTTPAMIQRQPIEEEEEELLQATSANGVIQRQADEEEELLQRQPIGDATLQRQIEPEKEEEEELLQTKLSVGQPNDVYEQEADSVAEQVMRMPEPSMRFKPT